MIEEGRKYFIFGFCLFLTQIVGYGIITMAIFALSLLPVMSSKTFLDSLKEVYLFVFFLLFSIGVGVYFALCDGLHSWNIPYWGQFYFLCFGLLAVKDKPRCLETLKMFVWFIFLLDFGTNLLFLIGVNVPWAILPPVRPGETIARFPGFKGNTLYSGSISFISMCYMFYENKLNKKLKYAGLVMMAINLVLSGSYRYFIIAAVVATMYYLHLYRKKIMMVLMYMVSILVVGIATIATMFVNLSNFYRAYIWSYFVGEILKSPIIGHGFFNIHLDEIQDFSTPSHLIANGVTESCILTLGYSFGLPVLFLFLASIFKTLTRYSTYHTYSTELGLYIGLTLDLFWGGSFDNTMSFGILLLSLYTINHHALVNTAYD